MNALQAVRDALREPWPHAFFTVGHEGVYFRVEVGVEAGPGAPGAHPRRAPSRGRHTPYHTLSTADPSVTRWASARHAARANHCLLP